MKYLKWTGIGILVLLLLMAVGTEIYLSDYYHSTQTLSQMQEESSCAIQETEYGIEIYGKNIDSPQKTGIIFYPGGKVEYTAYIPLLERLAEQGYPCFICKMPGNLAVFDIDAGVKVMEAYLEIENWYIAGHSLGGAMASAFSAEQGDGMKGTILLAAYPSSDLRQTNQRMVSIKGSCDLVLNQEKYVDNKNNAPKDSIYEVIKGGNHAYFGDYGEQKGDGTAEISREEQQKEAARLIIRFLER